MSNPYRERRMGQFRITSSMFSRFYDQMKQILSQVVVLKAEYEPHTDCYLYSACSEIFDKVEEGYAAYYYVIHREENIIGNAVTYLFSFEKVDCKETIR